MRLSAIARTRWASRPGRITLITLATPSAVGDATVSTAFLTLSWTLGSSVVLRNGYLIRTTLDPSVVRIR